MCIDQIVWRNIPPDSTIELSVAPASGVIVAGADVRSNLTGAGQWSDAELRPGPRTKAIAAGERLIVDVRVANPGTVAIGTTVTAVLKDRGGAILAGPTTSPLSPPCQLAPGTHHLLNLDGQALTGGSAQARSVGIKPKKPAAKPKPKPEEGAAAQEGGRMRSVAAFLQLAAFAVHLEAQTPACRAEESMRECFDRMTKELGARHDAALAGAPEELLSRQVTGIGTLGSKLASSISDFLPAIAGAIGLTQTTTENGGSTFEANLRIPVGASLQKIQLRLGLTKPELFLPVRDTLLATGRQARVAELERTLDDFDDAEVSLAWNLETRAFGRSFEPVRPMASGLFARQRAELDRDPEAVKLRSSADGARDRAVPTNADAMDPALIGTRIGERECRWAPIAAHDSVPVGCYTTEWRERIAVALLQVAVATERIEAKLDSTLRVAGFYQLGVLVNNQPQLAVQVGTRLVDDLVGPDRHHVSLRYETGFTNINALRRFGRTNCGAAEDAAITPDCLRRYLADPRTAADLKHGDRFFISLAFSPRNEYRFASPVDSLTLRLDGSSELSGGMGYGRYVTFDRAGEAVGRLDLGVEYLGTGKDSLRQDRVVAAATYTHRLSPTLSVAAGISYASRPEFLGDVDKKLGANFGLRYKLIRS